MNKSGEYVSNSQIRGKKRIKTKTPHATAFENSNGVVQGISVMGAGKAEPNSTHFNTKQQYVYTKPLGPSSANPTT
jgi:hypothetical protein